MKYFKLILFFEILAKTIAGFRFSLPGDPSWPMPENFLNLKKQITGDVIIRGEKNFKPNTWNKINSIPKPAVIIKPKSTQDIVEALKFSKKYNIRLSVQSTGHHQDYRNIFDNSIHLDMSLMNRKSIDLKARMLTLETGNNFSQIHKFVEDKSNGSLVVLSGQDPGVGIYGWTAGGGHGPLTRQFGLGVDNLVSIDLVLSNFSIITASETQNSDLFRAIRGSGGGTYGIAVNLTLKLHETPGKMSVFVGSYDTSSKTADLLSDWIKTIPNEVFAFISPNNFEFIKYTSIFAACFGGKTKCETILSKLKSGCIVNNEFNINCEPQYEIFENYYEYFKNIKSDLGNGIYLSSTALNSSNIQNGMNEIFSFVDKTPYTGCSGNVVLGGLSSQMDQKQEKTCVSGDFRNGLMAITCYAMISDNYTVSQKEQKVKIMDDFAEKVLKKYSKWVYWNEPQHNFPQNDWKERYWGGIENYNKLLQVKTKFDPDHLFTCYHCVGYEKLDNEMPSVCPAVNCTCSNTPNGVCSRIDNIFYEKNSCSFLRSTNILTLIILVFKLLNEIKLNDLSNQYFG